MECPNCQKTFWRNVKVIGKNGLEQRISFCCYECYLEFWKGVSQFVPLQGIESEPETKPKKFSFWGW